MPSKKTITKKAFSLIELSIVILVIGILVAGVVSGSKMVYNARLKTARSLTLNSPVASIQGLQMWVETTTENSIKSYTRNYNPEDGDLVTQWNDINPQSSSKINPSQSNTSYMPAYKENGIGGLPSILMTGDASEVTSIAPVLSATGARAARNNTIFAIFKVHEFGTFSNDIFAIAGSNCGHAVLFEINSSNIRSLYRYSVSGGGGESFNSTGVSNAFKTYKDYILSSSRDLNKLTTKLWINNQIYINQTIALDEPNNTNNSVVIGNLLPTSCGTGGLYRSLNGEISEVIYFDRALPQADIDAVEAYLSRKYDIKLN